MILIVFKLFLISLSFVLEYLGSKTTYKEDYDACVLFNLTQNILLLHANLYLI